MNKEKLINSILRDIDELREITEEIKNDRSASLLEANLAFSKAGLLLHEFQLLKEKYIGGNQQNVAEKEVVAPISFSAAAVVGKTDTKVVVEELSIPEETTEPVAEVVEMQYEPLLVLDEDTDFEAGEPEEEEEVQEEIEAEVEEEEEELVEEEQDAVEEEQNLVEGEDDLVEGEDNSVEGEDDLVEGEDDLVEGEDDPAEGEDDLVEGEDDPAEGEDDLVEEPEEEEEEEEEVPLYVKEVPDFEEEFEVEEEPEEEPEEEFDEEAEFEEEEEPDPSLAGNQTIGEKFHAEKSVNDIMGNHQENGTLDQKFAHGPISSLQSAIGINDRFLFIREIFNNDAQLYATAIKRLDSCNDIREAVEYLSNNFRIKKTETSLKFVDLIKRRFVK